MNARDIPPNPDLEEMGLINQKLLEVDGYLARRYNQVIKEVFGLESDLGHFRVDKRGLSPELARHFNEKYPGRLEYPENYLNIGSANRFVVIVSPEQRDASLVAKQASYDGLLLDRLYENARHTIRDVTEREALFGKIELGISVCRSAIDLMQLRSTQISLDTLEHTVQDVLRLKSLSGELATGDNALDDKYVGEMMQLAEKVGDARTRDIAPVFPVTHQIHCFYVEFYGTVHCLRNFKREDGVRQIFVTGEAQPHQFTDPALITMALRDPELLDTLAKYSYLAYDTGLIEARTRQLEDQFLLGKGLDVVEMHDYERERVLRENQGGLPARWHELRSISLWATTTGKDLSKYPGSMSYNAKLLLASAREKKQIVNHLLSELDPTDYERTYASNTAELLRVFPQMPQNFKRYAVAQIVGNNTDKR